MNDRRSRHDGRTGSLVWLVGLLALLLGGPIYVGEVRGDDSPIQLRQISPPTDWKSSAPSDRWIRTTPSEWKAFLASLAGGTKPAQPSAPVLMEAVYRASFDGQSRIEGTLDWSIHRLDDVAGFVDLGRSSLSVSDLKWAAGDAIHGINASDEWKLWSEAGADRFTGKWAAQGGLPLQAVVFDLVLPRSLSSRLEIRLPAGWVARIPGVIGPAAASQESPESSLWTFDLGRQQNFQLKLEPKKSPTASRILVRENTIYDLTNTDDLIRLQTEFDCTIADADHAEFVLAAPKTLRIFNVLLGNDQPLAFQRELGSEEDQIRVPLRSLTPGQRLTLRILGESQRRADRAFTVPRLRPFNATLEAGVIRVAVREPLEVRTAETSGLRQTMLTAEAGQEIRSYEVQSNDCKLDLLVGEPAAQLQGEILFMADVRGESPVSRVRARLSTREGELFSPQMIIPQGWEVISVHLTEPADSTPAAWQVSEALAGDRLLSLELRQPIRPDRDCTLLLELKSVMFKPGVTQRLPIPTLRAAQNCFARGVVLDHGPWELDESSTGTVELDGSPVDDELRQAVKWSSADDTRAIPTGVRVSNLDPQTRPVFRTEGPIPVDPGLSVGHSEANPGPQLLCANLEVETRTSRVGKSHPHRALFRFSKPAVPGEFRLTIPPEAELTRILTDDREVPFVRRNTEIILDPAAKSMSELVLEYRTQAIPSWVVSKDEVVFPQLNCPITEFAWHLVLDPERMLYRVPITAAVSPRQQPRSWERFLGPLARHAGELAFNPFSRSDWSLLESGVIPDERQHRDNDVWFVAAQIPSHVTLKTWNLDVSHGLAWCSFLGALASGIALRRARNSWFRRGWIYLGGAWLVIAVFVVDPYAPISGGAFLGSLLALIIPRRYAIGRDWLAVRKSARDRSTTGSEAVVTALLVISTGLLCPPVGEGQDSEPSSEYSYFEIEENGESQILFEARLKPLFLAWQEQIAGPPWLLKSARYDIQSETSGPPRIVATYEVAVFGTGRPSLLRLPLEGVSLDQVEGQIDDQPVRLIPAADRKGFVLPLSSVEPAAEASIIPETQDKTSPKIPLRKVTLRFRPLPDGTEDAQATFTATIPPLPECVVHLPSGRWKVAGDGAYREPTERSGSTGTPLDSKESEAGVTTLLGPARQLRLTSGTTTVTPRENLNDVQIRTLVESGPLGSHVQLGVLPTVIEHQSPAEVTITLPAGMHLQSVVGPLLEQYETSVHDAESRITLRLRPSLGDRPPPIEITGFLPVSMSEFRIDPPRWRPHAVMPSESLSSKTAAVSRRDVSSVGVIAQPGFTAVDASPRTVVTPISPQAFSDSLFAGMVWQVPDLAWTSPDDQGPAWTLQPISSPSQAMLSQTLTLKSPQSDWRLDATVSIVQGVPFEHVFVIDPRIEISRVTVQQDGADRLLRWTRSGERVQLSIRDGRPGAQTIRIEGSIQQGSSPWAPPICRYESGQTTESTATIRNTSRVVSTLKWTDSTTGLRPNEDQSDEEVRYQPDTPGAPVSIQVDPTVEERSARAWLELIPQRDSSWQITLRAQMKDSAPLSAPVQIEWDQPGLADLRLTNRRDNVRQSTRGEALLWRPISQGAKPTELSLSATLQVDVMTDMTVKLPKISGINWSEIWVSLPRGAGFRPARGGATLLSAPPPQWPASWAEGLSNSREDVFQCSTAEIVIEASTSEPQVRPVLAETLIWMDGVESTASPMRFGVTKYLLIAERDIALEVNEHALPMIRAMSVDGLTQPAGSVIRVPSRPNDLSHEVVIWWSNDATFPSPAPVELVRFSRTAPPPHWVGIIPPHYQVLLNPWGGNDSHWHNYWLSRSEALLQAASEFQGAPWVVDGPLLHALSDSREELQGAKTRSPVEADRLQAIETRWEGFSRTGGSISSPTMRNEGRMEDAGLSAILALCGESRSLWVRPLETPQTWPRLLNRRWAIAITATLASLLSLGALMWVVRLFRKLDIAERLAARPNATLIGMGIVWWAFLSPSILGLGLAFAGVGLWGRDRMHADSSSETTEIGPSA